jgi:hypothetical protein
MRALPPPHQDGSAMVDPFAGPGDVPAAGTVVSP